MTKFKMRSASLRGDETGSSTIEFVLWVPLFVVIMSVIMDATLLLQKQSQMFDTARAVTRQYSLGLKTEAEAEAFAGTILGSGFNTDVDPTSTPDIVRTQITIPTSEVVIFTGSFFRGGTIKADFSMVIENPVSEG